MLLYNGGQSSGSGDFISVNIVNGFLVLSYDLGSGVARISSLRLVPLPSPPASVYKVHPYRAEPRALASTAECNLCLTPPKNNKYS